MLWDVESHFFFDKFSNTFWFQQFNFLVLVNTQQMLLLVWKIKDLTLVCRLYDYPHHICSLIKLSSYIFLSLNEPKLSWKRQLFSLKRFDCVRIGNDRNKVNDHIFTCDCWIKWLKRLLDNSLEVLLHLLSNYTTKDHNALILFLAVEQYYTTLYIVKQWTYCNVHFL